MRPAKPWHLIVALVLLCGGLMSAVFWWRTRPALSVGEQLRYVPSRDGAVVFLDTGRLRRAGILAVLSADPAMEEKDYRDFVQGTGFDYREDLDTVLLAWREETFYILVTGHFQWERIAHYAVASGGRCARTLCWVRASTPDRFISIIPLRTGVLGVAVGDDPEGAFRLTQKQAAPSFEIPSEPVWASFPQNSLTVSASTPAGLSTFLRSLAGVRRATVSLGGSLAQLELNLRGDCADAQAARQVTSHLAENTDLLRKLISRENRTPNPADLSGVLTAGVFEARDTRVLGRWPISREFIEALSGGRLE